MLYPIPYFTYSILYPIPYFTLFPTLPYSILYPIPYFTLFPTLPYFLLYPIPYFTLSYSTLMCLLYHTILYHILPWFAMLYLPKLPYLYLPSVIRCLFTLFHHCCLRSFVGGAGDDVWAELGVDVSEAPASGNSSPGKGNLSRVTLNLWLCYLTNWLIDWLIDWLIYIDANTRVFLNRISVVEKVWNRFSVLLAFLEIWISRPVKSCFFAGRIWPFDETFHKHSTLNKCVN